MKLFNCSQSFTVELIELPRPTWKGLPPRRLDWAILDILDLLALLADYSVGLLQGYLNERTVAKNYILKCYEILSCIALKLDCKIKDLTDLDYRKLNSEIIKHGWKE